MISCPNCGKKNSDDNKFCGECGAKLPEPKNYCPNCVKTYTTGEKFCTECGTRLVNKEKYYQMLEELRQKKLDYWCNNCYTDIPVCLVCPHCGSIDVQKK